MFEGVLPALITPFKQNGDLDEEGLRRNIELLGETGISGIVPCGTTGESATLTHEEHKRVVEVAVECSKVPVVAGTGSNNTAEAVELTRHAADVGASAALLITPYYNKPNDAGMLAHYSKVAESADIPLVLYNVPGRTGVDIKPELVAKLAEIRNVAAIKEAISNLTEVSRVIELTRDRSFSVLSGEDGLTVPMLSLGATGVISVVANVAPSKMVDMVKSFRIGDLEKARRLHYELSPLTRALFLETNPIPVKTACRMMGLAAGPLRLPLAEMTESHQRELEAVVRRLGEF
ncbi:MAG: 4-hydroxy-tetrahydrodipicolinate synthase [Methanosaeta sp. PtaB.Bin039]|mgnify:CR=1 FL=1|nr:MAG: 4-hydroxy-tetrahydrodipicolinate synthase [Methanosaeta sp. PtaB.Bin039]OPY47396.1 MAG: 4-hydroxy-tetrahydrodipicolinate synthase [Methanosaeta sp. PtaU1.Bin028]HOT07125.1 4-hydroxy-tetrahydrodipicolinate synthase [Methanotrichaceae archaeon]HQF17069.1 4-hydroxy-tetrahydrodipicolinate synthase [Methanotrichaceae archaeon]HQI91690.1 4-hydroxy-tetrahydrodipicolinate synthase [Methanotrichaceae archaeon]